MEEKHIAREISRTNNLLIRYCLQNDFKKEIHTAPGKHGWIIGYLAEHADEEIFQRDIEETFSIRRSTVSNIVKLMEQKGYVKRESVKYDARLKKLVLTPKALETNRKIKDSILEGEEKIKQGISEKELKVFFDVLEKIQKNLEE